jgi:hypothetical protein
MLTTTQFLDMFAAYNRGVWPAQLGLILLALAAVGFGLRGSRRLVPAILAVFWLWMGVVFHLIYFAPVNPAARIFGVVFVVQAALFAWLAWRGGVSFRPKADAFGAAGAVFVLYALLLYPLIGTLAGHTPPAAPTFGAPCPTTIFTFGLLLWAEERVPRRLLVIPFVWALAGMSAVWVYGIVEDVGLPIAAGVAVVMLLRRRRTATRRARTSAGSDATSTETSAEPETATAEVASDT